MPMSVLYRPTVLSAAFVVLASCVLLLGMVADPPQVDVSALHGLDDGSVVTVRGVVVDLRAFDTGSDMLVILDLSGAEIARIQVSPGCRPRPSAYTSIGDLVAATGRVVLEGQVPVVYSSSDCIVLVAESPVALSVCMGCDNWQLFIYDEFKIQGYVQNDGGSGAFCLVDSLGASGPRLRIQHTNALQFVEGKRVTVLGKLTMDPNEMSLVLTVRTISLAP
ncbi:MAG: hypothetical protein QXZ19_00505 [Thermoplasmata archaeon]